MVPQTVYETQTIQVPKTVMVAQTGVQQIPRTVTSYAAQTVQEPIQVMVPQTQTVNTIQTINKVTEYARTPVNTYSYAGPTTTMPVTTGMPMTTGMPYYGGRMY